MREIKFRGWHEGVPAKGKYKGIPAKMLYDEKPGDVLRWKAEGQPITVQQFTGLQDKNGKDIYEGDILNYSNRDNHHCEFSKDYVVEFCSQDFGGHSYHQSIGWNVTAIQTFNDKELTHRGNGIRSLFGCHKIEVVGNIHDQKGK